MRSLTTPIPMPNITKIDPVKSRDYRDDDVPSFVLVVQLRGAGGRDAGTFDVTARDTVNSQGLFLNASPAGYGDVVLGGAVQIDGACTTIGNAYDNAAGSRAAKRDAALGAAMACGLIGLAAT